MYVCVCMHACVLACVNVHVRVHVCMHMCVNLQAYAHGQVPVLDMVISATLEHLSVQLHSFPPEFRRDPQILELPTAFLHRWEP